MRFAWADEAKRMVAQFRATHDLRADEPAFLDLLRRLREGCPEFAGWWSAHDVRAAAAGRKRLWHPKKGVLAFEHTSFQANDDPALKLVVYTASGESRGVGNMQDRHIGDVRVTRIEEQMGPGFPAKDFFPEFDAEAFKGEQHWLAPSYFQPESGRLMTSIHSWLLRTGKHTILVD
eukprot:gene15035-19210_t